MASAWNSLIIPQPTMPIRTSLSMKPPASGPARTLLSEQEEPGELHAPVVRRIAVGKLLFQILVRSRRPNDRRDVPEDVGVPVAGLRIDVRELPGVRPLGDVVRFGL